jgi:hypothetical protein
VKGKSTRSESSRAKVTYPPGMKPANWSTAMAVTNRLARHAKRARGSFTWRDIARLFRDQKGRCAYCCVDFPRKRGTRLVGVQAWIFHIEHKTPVYRGGTNDPGNLCLSCGPCNEAKGTMTAEEFLVPAKRPFVPKHVLRKAPKSLDASSDEAARRAGGDEDVPRSALKAGPTDLELTT